MRKLYFSTNSFNEQKYSLLDDEDFERCNQFKWCVYSGRHKKTMMRNHYQIVRNPTNEELLNGWPVKIMLHRYILNLKKENVEIVDHIFNWFDNRKNSLRITNNKNNSRYQRKRMDNTSGYKGVSWNKQKQKYTARIMGEKRSIFLGYFDCPKEAHKVYCIAATEHFGEFARFA